VYGFKYMEVSKGTAILIVKSFTLKILVREGAVRNLVGLHALYLFKIK
jgi:hypothetical protein